MWTHFQFYCCMGYAAKTFFKPATSLAVFNSQMFPWVMERVGWGGGADYH